jgi:prepilin-type N-terminal cleavage/methylation domain-containing protein
MNSKQHGFTMVEIAIVLVIIGLLLGGILKGRQLINSARVRDLVDASSDIQAAYYGFLDRYRRIPGDWNQASATTGIGVAVTNPLLGPTTDNGRLDTTIASPWLEANAMWEQLALAGFIQGAYPGTNGVPAQANGFTPLNAFNTPIIVGITSDYFDPVAAPPARLHMVMGRNIPVDVMRELDVKIDDAAPHSGDMRATIPLATVFVGGPVGGWGGMTVTCTVPGGAPAPPFIWNVGGNAQDCNAIIIF